MEIATPEKEVVPGAEAGLRPEIELLLCCARLSLPAASHERIGRLIEGGLDWKFLLNAASGHGLLPLLYLHLNRLSPGMVPKAVLADLWARHELNARRNQAMAKELLSILQILDAQGIAAIPYKGPTLAAAVYGDLALREFGDLDILLRLEDVLRAKTLLEADGYVPEYALKPAVEAAFLRSRMQYHLVVLHPARAVMVELHWKTDADFPVEPAQDARWWADLAYVDFMGAKVRRFASEELLLVLCLHGTKHGWSSLGWLVDVAELIRQHPDLDWDRVSRRATHLQCARRLGVGLTLVDELLGAPVPERIKRQFAGLAKARVVADKIRASLFRPDFAEMSAFEGLRFNLSLYERPMQKFAHCTNVLLAPSLVEWSTWPLPRALFWLYLPLRVVRLVKKYSLKFLARSGSAK